jgi:ABC-type glycerol-3-phosphate transport system permease component
MPMVTRPEFLPGLPNWSRKTFFALALAAICFAFAFPVLWLILTSLRPESGVYYVHRGTEFTLGISRKCSARNASSKPSSTEPSSRRWRPCFRCS